MKLCDLFKEIESTRFQSRYMLFSGFKLVRKAMSRDQTIAELINEVRLNPSYIDNVGKRILFLCAEYKDKPGATFDIAVAAYLYCLYMTNQHFANRMSEYVLQTGKLWWSVDLALHIKKNMEMIADAVNWNFMYPTPTEYIGKSLSLQPIRLDENVSYIVYGAEKCNISGQFSVKSPQKISSPVRSVSLTY